MQLSIIYPATQYVIVIHTFGILEGKEVVILVVILLLNV